MHQNQTTAEVIAEIYNLDMTDLEIYGPSVLARIKHAEEKARQDDMALCAFVLCALVWALYVAPVLFAFIYSI